MHEIVQKLFWTGIYKLLIDNYYTSAVLLKGLLNNNISEMDQGMEYI